MMAAATTATSSPASVYYTHCCCHSRPPKKPAFLFFNPIPKPTNPFSLSFPNVSKTSSAPLLSIGPNPTWSLVFAAKASSSTGGSTTSSSGEKKDAKKEGEKSKEVEEEEVEVEEELPWIQEKALDLVEFTGSVTQAIPGPRVGRSSLPWFLAVPLAYFGITFVFALVKAVRKFNSPKEKRRKLVCISKPNCQVPIF